MLIPRTRQTNASRLLAVAVIAAMHAWTGSMPAHETASNPANSNGADSQLPLPRVLILGDSISIGYTPFVKQLLEGRAEVYRPDANCGPTTFGRAQIDHWLGDETWDVIHFNFGLHDLKHVGNGANLVPVGEGKIQVPIKDYQANLITIVHRLQETGAALIWCTTTPVPPGATGRISGDARRYNAAAAAVMRRTLGEDRATTDLFAFCEPRLAEIQQPANVHFTKDGSRLLARQVSDSIVKQLDRRRPGRETARGVVFHDINANRVFDSGDQPLRGIRVSNGHEIVETDGQGRYRLPVSDDAIVFVIKPRGYQTPRNDQQLPQFYYIHKPNGSPPQRFPGVAPTGPLPDSIDFPLTAQHEPDTFKAIMFGDPQPRNQQEVDYISHDVIEELIGTDASFGVTLGDITFDNLDLFEPQSRAIAVLGVPWYNVIGNHDLNYDATLDDQSDESFEQVFGPAYYSFDYGSVHFLVIDNVEWLIDEDGKGRYQGGLGQRQLGFIRRDLQSIPADQLVVLMMHIPLTESRDANQLYRLIEQRPFSMSISAHTHTHVHRYLTRKDGWLGPEPHHHVINVTVSGSWWSGQPDERGIPHALMADGAPNGYSIVSFDGHKYAFEFKAAGRSADYQMAIFAPEVVKVQDGVAADTVEVIANVFNGSERSEVTLRLGQQTFQLERTVRDDPAYVAIRDNEAKLREAMLAQGVPKSKLWTPMGDPNRSTHIWSVQLPLAAFADGTNVLRITAKLSTGANSTVSGQRLIRIERE